MIQETTFLWLVGSLNVVFEDLILKLGNEVVMDLEIHKAVAVVCLKAVGYLEEKLRL